MSAVRVGEIEDAIARRFPPERAEGWDRVGLLAGDRQREVTGVVLALDPTPEAIGIAAEIGANVLVTHHPAFLDPPAVLRPGRGPGGIVFAALDAGVALINAHTNLDRDEQAQLLLPHILGLSPVGPLESSLAPMVLVTVYAPQDAVQGLSRVMEEAGAGRIGDYTGCSFAADGVGTFTAPENASPRVGAPGVTSHAGETRLEMVCPPRLRERVVAAAVAAHPYEEPLLTACEVMIARNSARLGMVCATPAPETLRGLATLAGEAFGVRPRVWGGPDTIISRVATATGSAGSLVGAALSAEAQALVAGEVRYHDALEAKSAGLCVIELGHDVTEWPLVGLLESVVRSVPGLDSDSVHRLPASVGWWTT